MNTLILSSSAVKQPVVSVSVIPQLCLLESEAAAKDASNVQQLAAEAVAELQTAYLLLKEVRDWMTAPEHSKTNIQTIDLLDRLDKSLTAGAAR